MGLEIFQDLYVLCCLRDIRFVHLRIEIGVDCLPTDERRLGYIENNLEICVLVAL